jgi:predicted Fe-S protein YdhL (DUF1289 family)
MIKSHETQFAVTLMCRVLSVAKAGYYHWKNRAPSARDEVWERLTQEVKRVLMMKNLDQARFVSPSG